MDEFLHPIRLWRKKQLLYIVPGSPTLYIKENNTLIFADLHLGFEEAVARGLDYSSHKTGYAVGMFIPKIQLKRILEILRRVFNNVRPKRIIINGDLKHAFDRLLRQERKEVRILLDFLLENDVDEIIVVRGNHDNYLPLVLKDYGIDLVKEYVLKIGGKNILFTHGHIDVDIDNYDCIVIGHEHPSLRCFGSYRFPVYLVMPYNKQKYIIVLPASGPYHPGTHVSLNRDDYLSPIVKKHGRLDLARIITWIDLGEYLGFNTDFNLDTRYSSLDFVSINRYIVNKHEYAVIEFSNIETAYIMCGAL